MPEQHSSTPVAVAVSGGADSLFSLIMLLEQGYSVMAMHGIFLESADAAHADAQAAMRERLAEQCAALGVPLHCVDMREQFLEQVIRPFVASYAAGHTPNPCALCNRRIKFGLLLREAKNKGASYLATGHYAQLLHEQSAIEGGLQGPWPALLQGEDAGKDQSYFLALTPLEALRSLMFPLARTHKRDVLGTFAERGITPPQPGESQEVCFVPGDAYREFLPAMAERLGIALPGPGKALLPDGSCIAQHQGLWRYTEGQRRGLGIGWKEPLYVRAKRTRDNALLLGTKTDLGSCGCECRDINCLVPPEQWPETVLVKTRYREQPRPAKALLHAPEGSSGSLSLELRFPENRSVIAPGQIAAVYAPITDISAPLRLLAGGIITRGI